MDNTLDIEELEKRVALLDDEQRNNKTVIAALQSRLESLTTENDALRLRLTDMESDVTRINTLMTRLEQYDLDIKSIRTDIGRQIESFKEKLDEKERQTEKNKHRIEDLHSNLTDLEKNVQDIKEINKTLEDYKGNTAKLGKQMEGLKTKLDDFQVNNEDHKRSLHLIEENRRQDSKRLTDLQGEIAAARKRQEETRGKQDLIGDTIHKLENRIKELLEAESERREGQTAFMEKINLAQIERDNTFKEWASRFNAMEQINKGLEKELAGLENTHHAVKQSQAALDEVTQRFERRVNEITEIQRLNEDRFRQEWTTFKSDDQKRWSNYTLAQAEQQREMNRVIENLGNRLSSLEELVEKLRENLQQVGKDDINRMQTLLSSLRESIEVYNNIFKE